MIPFGLPPAPPGSPAGGSPPAGPAPSRQTGARDAFAAVFHEFVGRQPSAGGSVASDEVPAGERLTRSDDGALVDVLPFIVDIPFPGMDLHGAGPWGVPDTHAADNLVTEDGPVDVNGRSAVEPAAPGLEPTAPTPASTDPNVPAAHEDGDTTFAVRQHIQSEAPPDHPVGTTDRPQPPEVAPARTPPSQPHQGAAQPAVVPDVAAVVPGVTATDVSAEAAARAADVARASAAATPPAAEAPPVVTRGEARPDRTVTTDAPSEARQAAAARVRSAAAPLPPSGESDEAAARAEFSAAPNDTLEPVGPRPSTSASDMAAAFVAAAGAQARPVAAAVAAASAPLWAPPVEQDLQHQIVQSLWLNGREGGGEARVRLKPDYLGELSVRVSVQHGVVTARLEADTPSVREWISRHEASLRQALGDYGLTLEMLTVEAPSRDERPERRGDAERREPEQQPDRQRRPRHRPGEEAPRFEVLV